MRFPFNIGILLTVRKCWSFDDDHFYVLVQILPHKRFLQIGIDAFVISTGCNLEFIESGVMEWTASLII